MDETDERAESGPTTVGAMLKAAREERGQTLEDISRQTRVPARHLVQIEEGRLEGLPAAPYSSGFVKAYARAVDLDPTLLSQQFRGELAQSAHVTPRIQYEPYEPADPTRLPPRLLAIVALVIAVVLALGYGIFRSGLLTGETADQRAQLAAHGDDGNTAAPSATAPTQAAPAAAPAPTGGPVQLVATAPTWVKISERSGPVLFQGVLDQGKTYDVPPTAQDPVIRTGKPEGLQVTVGGQAVAPLGEPAHTISNVSLKADALLARGAAAPAAAPAGAAPAPAPAGGSVPTAFQAASGGNSQ